MSEILENTNPEPNIGEAIILLKSVLYILENVQRSYAVLQAEDEALKESNGKLGSAAPHFSDVGFVEQVRAMAKRSKIKAIKFVRAETNLGLYEAKLYVDSLVDWSE